MKIGDIVIHKLTGECIMLIEKLCGYDAEKMGYAKGWLVRRMDFELVKVADFEIMERELYGIKTADTDSSAV